MLDVLSGTPSQAEAYLKHGLNPTLLARWKATFLERAHTVFASDATRSAEQARITELESAWPTSPSLKGMDIPSI